MIRPTQAKKPVILSVVADPQQAYLKEELSETDSRCNLHPADSFQIQIIGSARMSRGSIIRWTPPYLQERRMRSAKGSLGHRGWYETICLLLLLLLLLLLSPSSPPRAFRMTLDFRVDAPAAVSTICFFFVTAQGMPQALC